MKVWHFTESPYPGAWGADKESLRVTLPNRHFDPVQGADLLNEYLDAWAMCDEFGLHIMVNEHHSTPTCVTASCMLPLAILARQTKRARLLCLGVPIGVRHDPLLVAEELSYVDLVSRGRLEMGLVKGFPSEIAPSNINPATVTDRFWEAHDLIIKAMTTHDGPFNWEGDHFHFRQVNIWPRPFQSPHPPIWHTAFGPQSAALAAERGYKICSGMNAPLGRSIFNSYRLRAAQLGLPAPSSDMFGYLVLVGVGSTEEEGIRRLNHIRGHLKHTGVVKAPFSNPPGFVSVEGAVGLLKKGQKGVRYLTARDGRPINNATATLPELVDAGVCFAGTPDQVFEQIKDFSRYVGGCGNILAMMHGGTLSAADTAENLRLFSAEVLPRLLDISIPMTKEAEEFERVRERAGRELVTQ